MSLQYETLMIIESKEVVVYHSQLSHCYTSMISLTELGPSDVAVIREVYDSDNAQELFEMELERALEVNQLSGYEVYYMGPKYFKWI